MINIVVTFPATGTAGWEAGITNSLSTVVDPGELAGEAFRIGHPGTRTAPPVLAGLTTIEMAMADLDYPITLGAGSATAQGNFYQSAKSGTIRTL